VSDSSGGRGTGDGVDAIRDVSRILHARLLPHVAPRIAGFEVAAGTTTEESGRGGSAWDWVALADGRTALLTLDVRQDGFPPAYHIGVARAVIRALAGDGLGVPVLLAKVNDALAGAAIPGSGQFVDVGLLAVGEDEVEWASAGQVPGRMIRRNGSFEELGAHGPPLGMMGGFQYQTQRFQVSAGDTALVLSYQSQGLFRGIADLVAQLHGKPAGEIVSTLHRGVREALGDARTEASVLYARKH
jgi:serine phosphatase RsbU (regulator of sigma subunit)